MTVTPLTPTRDDIQWAQRRLAPYLHATPLEYSPALSELVGTAVHLKMEAAQVTGSFKPRISFNKLLRLTPESRQRGVVASTAGGHGIGLAYAAQCLGVAAVICLPRTADPDKVAAIRRYGAELRFYSTVAQARADAREIADQTGMTFVSAYNDPDIVAGGGTVGLEIADDLPETDLVVVGMGGGGLASGIGVALSDRDTPVWGVQPEGSAVLTEWLAAGHPVEVDTVPSIADGLGSAIETDSITFPLAQRYVRRSLTVSEAQIRAAVHWLAVNHHLFIEPSGAAPVAALLVERDRAREHKNVVVVLTGRNISLVRWLALVQQEDECQHRTE